MKTIIGISALTAAAIFATIPGASAQGNAAVCLQNAQSGAMDCKYQTMAQCEQAKKGASSTGNCINNPQTTGSGARGGGMMQPQGSQRR
jgi:hypothetical protein